MKYDVVFVCQKGFLELQSILLAISLRKNLVGDFNLVAAHPENLGQIDSITRAIFKKLDVEVKSFTNDFRPLFHMANKPFASTLVNEKILFVDSDIILFKPFTPEYLPESECFCFTEDPFFSYSPQEWEYICDLFGVIIPPQPRDKINLQCMNTPIYFAHEAKRFNSVWLEFTRKLYSKVKNNEIKMKRKRKVANMCFGMAVRSVGLDYHVSEPLTWDGNSNWWSYPACECHPWEKKLPVSQRKPNKYLSMPDLVYYYENDERKSHESPYFFSLPNGSGYCPTHQGGNFPVSIGLNQYPEIRSFIYSLLYAFPEIDQHPGWSHYLKRYFFNSDKKWFNKPKHYGKKMI